MIDARFIVNLKGRDFPTWPGVLDAATRAGLVKLTTTVVQIPAPDNGNVAVVMARAEFADGRVFEDIGDAGPGNCSPQIATAALRMASTRAKGRCLRDALNVGTTMLEELPDLAAATEPVAPIPGNGRSALPVCCECERVLKPAQATYSEKHYGRRLCPDHQRGASNGR